MKLILCKNCQDVVRLMQDEERFCRCGKCSGKYTDELNAWYKGGEFVVPLGFANSSLVKAVYNQPKEGCGENFSAFVIPKVCSTYKLVLEMERLADKTVEELKQIREDYVKKYIGDFNKPFGYKSELKNLDRLIAAKG